MYGNILTSELKKDLPGIKRPGNPVYSILNDVPRGTSFRLKSAQS